MSHRLRRLFYAAAGSALAVACTADAPPPPGPDPEAPAHVDSVLTSEESEPEELATALPPSGPGVAGAADEVAALREVAAPEAERATSSSTDGTEAGERPMADPPANAPAPLQAAFGDLGVADGTVALQLGHTGSGLALGTRGRGVGGGGMAYGSIGARGATGSGALGRAAQGQYRDMVAAREQFEHYGENAWTSAIEDRLATFSIDVDTASYAISRRDLNRGVLPAPASVRIEEFVNAFDYGYAPPTGSAPFAVHLEAAPSRFATERTLLRVGIQGAETDPGDRAPANLVFLVDVSGSMNSADKLGLVKYALRTLLAGLGPDDTLSIVTYAGQAVVLLPPTHVQDRLAIVSAIEGLTAGGGTNGADGIRTAYELAERALVPGGTNRVIWCSDGDLNVGMRGDTLLSYIEERGRQGIALTTLGFGSGNYNDRDLERFANGGDGNYYYIDDRNEALRVLSDELISTLEIIARDVKIQVEVNPDVVRSYRLIGYENRDVADQDFRDDTVDAGEIGSGHSVTAYLELEMVGGNATRTPGPLATVRVRYELPGEEGEGREVEQEFFGADEAPRFDMASPAFRLGAAVVEFAEVLRMSTHTEGADFDAIEAIVRGAQEAGDLQVEELAALVTQARALWP